MEVAQGSAHFFGIRVTNVVGEVTKSIAVSKETQDNILSSQKESLKMQSNIMRENSALHEIVVSAKDVFNEVQ
jgi:hypothetical protein